ncbi:hypothetical protein PTKIN_Ptkin10aG0150100 [Pterospermum kingtungense]
MGSCRSLNPEAPEFFPAKNFPVSASTYPIFLHTNPPSFLHYPALTSLNPHAFSAPPSSHYPSYAYFHAVQAHLLEPFKTKMVLDEEHEARLARKGNVGGHGRRSYKDKYQWRGKSYRKEGLVKADSTQDCKKVWRAKSSSYSTGNNEHLGCNVDQPSFEYPRKVQGGAANNNREKHPPIPLKSDGKETTVMIRNIPNRYTREMLKDFLDQHCMLTNGEADQSQNAGTGADEEPLCSAFDFLYLPIDFVTKLNKGYAFVNFTKPGAARKFFDAWHDKHWECFKSNKIREIYCAKLQGMEQLVKHFEKMEFPSEDFQPLSFNPARDGSKQPVTETVVGRCTAGSRCMH